MRKRSGTMKKRMMHLLLEYLKSSKRSDRELAKVVGVSQPTITRMRQRLVKEGAIREFTVIPDFVKMGYEIMAISCLKTKKMMSTELEEKAERHWKKYPNVILVSRGEGMGKNGVLISLHKSYTDYSNFVTENLREWGDDIQEYDSMLIDLKGRIVKPLSLTYLGEQKEI